LLHKPPSFLFSSLSTKLTTWRDSYNDSYKSHQSQLNQLKEEKIDYSDILNKMMMLTANKMEIGKAWNELNQELRSMQDITFRSKHAVGI